FEAREERKRVRGSTVEPKPVVPREPSDPAGSSARTTKKGRASLSAVEEDPEDSESGSLSIKELEAPRKEAKNKASKERRTSNSRASISRAEDDVAAKWEKKSASKTRSQSSAASPKASTSAETLDSPPVETRTKRGRSSEEDDEDERPPKRLATAKSQSTPSVPASSSTLQDAQPSSAAASAARSAVQPSREETLVNGSSASSSTARVFPAVPARPVDKSQANLLRAMQFKRKAPVVSKPPTERVELSARAASPTVDPRRAAKRVSHPPEQAVPNGDPARSERAPSVRPTVRFVDSTDDSPPEQKPATSAPGPVNGHAQPSTESPAGDPPPAPTPEPSQPAPASTGPTAADLVAAAEQEAELRKRALAGLEGRLTSSDYFRTTSVFREKSLVAACADAVQVAHGTALRMKGRGVAIICDSRDPVVSGEGAALGLLLMLVGAKMPGQLTEVAVVCVHRKETLAPIERMYNELVGMASHHVEFLHFGNGQPIEPILISGLLIVPSLGALQQGMAVESFCLATHQANVQNCTVLAHPASIVLARARLPQWQKIMHTLATCSIPLIEKQELGLDSSFVTVDRSHYLGSTLDPRVPALPAVDSESELSEITKILCRKREHEPARWRRFVIVVDQVDAIEAERAKERGSNVWTQHDSVELARDRDDEAPNDDDVALVPPGASGSGLNAQAPTFVPTWSTPSTTAAEAVNERVEGSEPSVPIPIASPPSERDGTEGSIDEVDQVAASVTPQAVQASPLSRHRDEALDSAPEPTNAQDEGRPEPDAYPDATSNSLALPSHPTRTPSSASSTHNSIYEPVVLRNLVSQACSTGDLERLQSLMQPSRNGCSETSGDAPEDDRGELFRLANETSPNTGFAPVHYAAQRGHVEIVKWLVEEAGAMAEIEDSEGETALHKAAYRGHVEVCQLLVEKGVDVNARDADGWTPMHNAASNGSVPILRLLLSASASISPRNQQGYTPLMSAASKGHLPSVHFLLKRGANPLVRNRSGETAFDLAAGVFEVGICQVLVSYEKVQYAVMREQQAKGKKAKTDAAMPPYNVLALHSTVPVVLLENQRLESSPFSASLSASTSGRNWSSKWLSRNDKRAAFSFSRVRGAFDIVEQDGPAALEVDQAADKERACFKSEVGLPRVSQPDKLVIPPVREIRSRGRVRVPASSAAAPSASTTTTRRKLSRASSSLSSVLATSASPTTGVSTSSALTAKDDPPAWLWISSWSLDLSFSPRSSPHDGWSYAPSFDTPDQDWSPEFPPSADLAASVTWKNAKKYVRRRKWVRILRRRVDLPDWGYPNAPSVATALSDEAVDYRTKAAFIVDEVERSPASSLKPLPSTSGAPGDSVDSAVSLRKIAVRLERAADVLRNGIEGDKDDERKRAAQGDLEKVLHKIVLVRAELGREVGEEDADSDDEFIYNGKDAAGDEDDSRSIFTLATRPSSPLGSPSTPRRDSGDYFPSVTTPTATSGRTGFYQGESLTPSLSQNPDFRIPTNETAATPDFLSHPNLERRASSRGTSPGDYASSLTGVRARWEPDAEADACRRCSSGFTFFKRKHHCRRCGLVVCANCSTHRDTIDPYHVVRDPADDTFAYLEPWSIESPLLCRTCDTCHAALALVLPAQHPQVPSFLSPQSFFPPSPSIHGSVTPGSETGDSEASELTECPVCGAGLNDFGDRSAQEAHVRDCLDKGSGSVSSGRYLVFTLPPGPLVGSECRICYEDLVVGDRMARLVCLDTFHEACIRAWLDRGHGCPVHASTRDS
ncbi:hypothetical protein JCM10212_002082, partial [Sporobolomyces blumeae]